MNQASPLALPIHLQCSFGHGVWLKLAVGPVHTSTTLFQLAMNIFSLVCLFLLASIAAAQQRDLDIDQAGYPTPMPTEAFYRQQRTNLLETKQNLINMINQLRETIFKQQMLLNRHYDNQHTPQQHHPISE
nr:expressed conserved protein [Hymenolepis microstoma]